MSLTKVTIETWNESQDAFEPGVSEFDPSADFSISETDIDIDIIKHGQIMVEYGDRYAELKVMLSRKEEFVKYIHAMLSQDIRKAAKEKGEKVTEGNIAETVLIDPRYQDALADLNKCKVDAIKCDNYWRIAVKKADLLTSMAYKSGQEIKKMMG